MKDAEDKRGLFIESIRLLIESIRMRNRNNLKFPEILRFSPQKSRVAANSLGAWEKSPF
jgi:hypothetical protein